MTKRYGVILAISLASVIGLTAAIAVSADEDEGDEYGERGAYGMYGEPGEMGESGEEGEGAGSMWNEGLPLYGPRQPVPVDNALYQESCGSCHFAYQPGLLPARSWDRMMNGLADHFGENAELLPDEQKQVRDYLLANAADTSDTKRLRRIAESVPAEEAPLRISETAYFKQKHRELGRRMVQDNPEVGSFSKCEACHTRASAGSYREGEVRILGYGRYDD